MQCFKSTFSGWCITALKRIFFHVQRVSLLRNKFLVNLRECPLTTRGETNRSIGGSLNSSTLLWGDHKIPGTHYGGITKSNLKGSENAHLIKCKVKVT